MPGMRCLAVVTSHVDDYQLPFLYITMNCDAHNLCNPSSFVINFDFFDLLIKI